MPFVTTPFVVELRDLEELPLSRTAPSAGDSAATMLQSNTFTAAITSLTFAEESVVPADTTTTATNSSTSAASHGKDEDVAVRVSLLAHVASTAADESASNNTTMTTQCITIASHTFARLAPLPTAKRTANTKEQSTTNTPAEVYHLCLHSPLVLGSADAVQSLSVGVHSVLPHTKRSHTKNKTSSDVSEVQEDDKEEEEGISLRTQPYRGARRFVVRLIGQQLTELTAQQAHDSFFLAPFSAMLCEAANELRRLLSRAGADIHVALQVAEMRAMGGGVGMRAAEALQPGTRLVHFPARCILTVQKAAIGLAMLECNARTRLQIQDSNRAIVSATQLRPIQFATDRSTQAMEECETDSDASSTSTTNVDAVAAELRRTLGPTNTIVCYLLVMAIRRGRWSIPTLSTSTAPVEETECGTSCEDGLSGWMRVWLGVLPQRVDNLLELAAALTAASYGATTNTLPVTTSVCKLTRPFLYFARHRMKVEVEWDDVATRYRDTLRVLRKLSFTHSLLCNSEKDVSQTNAEASSTCTSSCNDECTFHQHNGTREGVTLRRYLWALNMLISRGFAYDVDIWAMMPFVDYFNYALDANATMHTERTVHSTLAAHSSSCVDEYSYTFITTMPVSSGEELCLSYGAYSDYELLLWYGFTLRPTLLPLAKCAALQEKLSLLQDTRAQLKPEVTALPVYFAPLRVEMTQLRNVMPYLCDPQARRVLYRMLHTTQPAGDTTDDAIVWENAYETWCTALQRAFSFEFGPMADIEGAYRKTCSSTDWMDELVARYLALAPLQVEHADDVVSAQVERMTRQVATLWHTTWSSALQRRNMSEVHLTLGCLGPSRAMKAWAMKLMRVARSHHLPDGSSINGITLIRGVAWMELRVNATHNTPAPSVGSISAELTSVSHMARVMSADAYVLLRFLALDASDGLLTHYWNYSPTY